MQRVLLTMLLLEAFQTVDIAAQQQVRVVKDIVYTDAAQPDSLQKLDLYLPQGSLPFPVIVAIHGGGLIEWDKKGSAHVGYCFASAGLATAVINYRLSPKVTHPAHIQDAAAAFAWVKRHIQEYGGDSGAVFMVGHSAGGYLASLLACDPQYLGQHNLSLQSIRGVVPVSAFHYVERVAPDRPKFVWGSDSAKWPSASPGQYINPESPPILLLYANGDETWRKNQNKEFAASLKQSGHRDFAIREVTERDHRSIWNNIKQGEEVSDLITHFVSQRVPSKKKN